MPAASLMKSPLISDADFDAPATLDGMTEQAIKELKTLETLFPNMERHDLDLTFKRFGRNFLLTTQHLLSNIRPSLAAANHASLMNALHGASTAAAAAGASSPIPFSPQQRYLAAAAFSGPAALMAARSGYFPSAAAAPPFVGRPDWSEYMHSLPSIYPPFPDHASMDNESNDGAGDQK